MSDWNVTQPPQQPNRRLPLSGELALGIAEDLESITDRIAEMKLLCDQQMGELADAAAAAADITQALSQQQPPVAADAGFATLKAELSTLYQAVAAQVEVHNNISQQFLAIAHQVGAEIKALHAAKLAPLAEAEHTDHAGTGNVVLLSARRAARNESAAQATAGELRLALQSMQDSAVALFRTQVQSRKMIASLRLRLRDHGQRIRNG